MLSKDQEKNLKETSKDVKKYYEENKDKVNCDEYIEISVESAAVLHDCIGRLQQNNGNVQISRLQNSYSIASKNTIDSLKKEIGKDSKIGKLLEEIRLKTLSKKEILNRSSKDYDKEIKFTKLLANAQYDIEKSKIEYVKKEEKIPERLYFNDENMKAMSDIQKEININFLKGIKEIYLDTACKYLGVNNISKQTLKENDVEKNNDIDLEEEQYLENKILEIDIDM